MAGTRFGSHLDDVPPDGAGHECKFLEFFIC
jgi:hypothetical protein